MPEETSSIDLNAIGVLVRREIEARIIAPLVEAFSQALGREKTIAITAEVIRRLAREQGRQLAARAAWGTRGCPRCAGGWRVLGLFEQPVRNGFFRNPLKAPISRKRDNPASAS